MGGANRIAIQPTLTQLLAGQNSGHAPDIGILRPTKIGGGPIAPYRGTYHLVLASNEGAPVPIAPTTTPVEKRPEAKNATPKRLMDRFIEGLSDFLKDLRSGSGEVREPGTTVEVPKRLGGGTATLISYEDEAMPPELASNLKKLYERSRRAWHEHYWGVYEQGEIFNQGSFYVKEGGTVEGPILFNKGKQLADFHTHPPLARFGHTFSGETYLSDGPANQFSDADVQRCQLLLTMNPDVVCAAVLEEHLLVYQKNESADPERSLDAVTDQVRARLRRLAQQPLSSNE